MSPRPSGRLPDPPLSLWLLSEHLGCLVYLGLFVLAPWLAVREVLIVERHEPPDRRRVVRVLRGQDLLERRRRPIGQILRPELGVLARAQRSERRRANANDRLAVGTAP